jgi:hypothetical protein
MVDAARCIQERRWMIHDAAGRPLPRESDALASLLLAVAQPSPFTADRCAGTLAEMINYPLLPVAVAPEEGTPR